MQGKYNTNTLLSPLRLFIEARNKAIKEGFTDNGGAIHSVERILDILCARIKYPNIKHIDNQKKNCKERSMAAHEALNRGESVIIEHVMPRRAFARQIIDMVNKGNTDEEIISFIKKRYRLVLLTKQEARNLNKLNRSNITDDRIADAGIITIHVDE